MEKIFTDKKSFFSFDKSFENKLSYTKPDKYRHLEEISIKSDKIINFGSNLSYSPLGFLKEGISMNIKKFNRILDFDKKKKVITVEAGISLVELLNFTLRYKLWIPQLPGYPTITIGGAVASNAHGKSCAIHGTIRKSVKQISLFHKKHGWLNLSENENKDVFELTIGGLGLTGTIVNVTLQLQDIESLQFLTKKEKIKNINDYKKIIKDKNIPSFIYTWNRADNLNKFGSGIVFKNQIINDTKVFKKFIVEEDRFKPSLIPLWNKYSIKLINFIYFRINQFSKKEKIESFLNVIFPFYGKERYFNFFGKKGFIESQLLIHESKLEAFISEFKYLYKIYEPTITLLSLKNMSGEQKLLRFEDEKICLTFDYVNNKKNLRFMSKIDDLYKKYEILPSIIKDSRISKKVFNETYNESSDFKEKLKIFDKERIYESEISRRLEI